jgi:hypothetical protein
VGFKGEEAERSGDDQCETRQSTARIARSIVDAASSERTRGRYGPVPPDAATVPTATRGTDRVLLVEEPAIKRAFLIDRGVAVGAGGT